MIYKNKVDTSETPIKNMTPRLRVIQTFWSCLHTNFCTHLQKVTLSGLGLDYTTLFSVIILVVSTSCCTLFSRFPRSFPEHLKS